MEHREIVRLSPVTTVGYASFLVTVEHDLRDLWNSKRLTSQIDMSGYFTKLGFSTTSLAVENKKILNKPRTDLTVERPSSTRDVIKPNNASGLVTNEHIQFEKIRQKNSKKRARPIEEFFETPPIGSLTPKSKERCKVFKRRRLLLPKEANDYHQAPVKLQIDKTFDAARRTIASLVDLDGLSVFDLARLTVTLDDVQNLLCGYDGVHVSNEFSSICIQLAAIDHLEKSDDVFGARVKATLDQTLNKINSIFSDYMNSIEKLGKAWESRNGLVTAQLNLLRTLKVNHTFLVLRLAEIKKRAASLADVITSTDEDGRSMISYIVSNPAYLTKEIQANIERHLSSAAGLETMLCFIGNHIQFAADALFKLPCAINQPPPLDIYPTIIQFETTPFIDRNHEIIQEYVLASNRYSLWTLFTPILKHQLSVVRAILDNRLKLMTRLCEGLKFKNLPDYERSQLLAMIEVETDIGDLYYQDLCLVRDWFMELWKDTK